MAAPRQVGQLCALPGITPAEDAGLLYQLRTASFSLPGNVNMHSARPARTCLRIVLGRAQGSEDTRFGDMRTLIVSDRMSGKEGLDSKTLGVKAFKLH